MVRYGISRLSYDYDELEPFIDAETMEIHHRIHHQAYADGLNRSLESIGGASHPQYISSILSDLKSVPESARDAVNFFGGGFENHRLFWECMVPDGDRRPGGRLEDSLDVYFEGYDNFRKIFSQRAASVPGSGWCWLVFNENIHGIEVVTTENQTSPWTMQRHPLLGLDVWEHAYYLKYQSRRSDYIDAWWNVVNWDYVGNRFSELSG